MAVFMYDHLVKVTILCCIKCRWYKKALFYVPPMFFISTVPAGTN